MGGGLRGGGETIHTLKDNANCSSGSCLLVGRDAQRKPDMARAAKLCSFGETSPHLLLSFPCRHQCPAFQGISFRDGTGRDFCKIPGSRDFPGRDLPHIFIPGFFGNCSGFFGIFLFDTIGDQFKHFSRAGKPNKHFFHQKKQTS